jgi:hypothetical protein
VAITPEQDGEKKKGYHQQEGVCHHTVALARQKKNDENSKIFHHAKNIIFKKLP